MARCRRKTRRPARTREALNKSRAGLVQGFPRLKYYRRRSHTCVENRPTIMQRYRSHALQALERIRADGFYKRERVIQSRQAAAIRLHGGEEVLNFCANNYLGLADDPSLVAAAK